MNIQRTATCLVGAIIVSCTSVAGAAIVTVDDDAPAQYDSIQAAVNDASSSEVTEIQLMPGVYTGDGDYVVDTLGKPVIIIAKDGSGTVTLDGKQVRGVIRCDQGEDEDTKFVDLILTGGWAQEGGGVYLNNTSPLFRQCVIDGNQSVKNGGGFFCSTGSPVLEDCHIANNTSGREGGGLYFHKSNAVINGGKIAANESLYSGGGVFVSGGRLQTSDCSLKENTTSLSGGGMAIHQHAEVNLEGCEFLDNQAGVRGGGLFSSENSKFVMDECVVEGNTANAAGGGISIKSCNTHAASLNFCKISNNRVLHQQGFGGGLYSLKSEVRCSDSKFIGNHAFTGGGLYIRSKADGSSPELHLMDGEVSGNTADNQGGGIYVVGEGEVATRVTLDGTMVKDNLAKHQGGGLFADNSSSVTLNKCELITNAVFTENYDTLMVGGGAIFSEQLSGTYLTDCVLAGNRSNRFAGAVYNRSGDAKFTHCRFRGNSSADNGGACYVVDGCDPRFEEGCLFLENQSSEKGGALYIEDSNPIINDTEFSANRARYGGAIFSNDHVSSIIQDCMFEQNVAMERGGAVASSNLSNPRYVRGVFLGNQAKRGGAAYAQLQSYPVYMECDFKNNKALDLGGAACDSSGSPSVYSSCTFHENEATGEDGGKGCGGAVHAHESAPRYMNSNFTANLAISFGGAIYNWNCAPEVTNCNVKENQSADGGGMYTTPGYQPPVKDSKICGNLPDQIVGEWLDLGGNSVSDYCLIQSNSGYAITSHDSHRNLRDLYILIDAWGTRNSKADINRDKIVDIKDLMMLIDDFRPRKSSRSGKSFRSRK